MRRSVALGVTAVIGVLWFASPVRIIHARSSSLLKSTSKSFPSTMISGCPSQERRSDNKSKFQGYFYALPRSRKPETLALFIDPSSTKIPASTVCPQFLFRSVAANANLLDRDFGGTVNDESLATDGKRVKETRHIGVFPIEGTAILDTSLIPKPLNFVPGALKSLNEVKARFGEPVEQEEWALKAARDLGLNGTVYWWGTVGLSAAATGSITHLLLRGESTRVADLPATLGVFYRNGEKYVPIPEQKSRGINLDGIVASQTVASKSRKFYGSVSIPGRTSSIVISEKRPRLLIYSPGNTARNIHLGHIDCVRMFKVSATQRVLWYVQGFVLGKTKRVDFIGRDSLESRLADGAHDYIEIQIGDCLLDGEYAVVDDSNPGSPRVWAFTVRASAGSAK